MMLDKIINQEKWQVRVAAMIIFILGFAAGALALNAYRTWRGNGVPPGSQDRFEQLVRELQLTDAQQTQVKQIFSDTREQLQTLRKESEPRVKEIRSQADERMQKILTAGQWQKFQQLMNERDNRRRARDSRNDNPPPGEQK
nr:Heavy-metal resistance [uncultured bacterium]AIA13394.1 Heavy-metal resistance [uncultured bacterium]